MRITTRNYRLAHHAMASILLLYYQLLRAGGFESGQTAYLATYDFNGFDFLEVEIADELAEQVDTRFLREGAVIFVLCELNDVLRGSDDFLARAFVQKILALQTQGKLAAVPEMGEVLDTLGTEEPFPYQAITPMLDRIFSRYVVGSIAAILPQSK